MLRGSRIVTVGAGVAAAVVVSVLPATGIPPEAGTTYAGQIAGAPSSQDVVNFVVSKDGNWVRKMRLGPWPLTGGCGSGGDLPSQSAKPARIKNGTFTAHVAYRGDGEVIARATVTGKFLRKGKEKGVVTSRRFSDSCVLSRPYSTHAE